MSHISTDNYHSPSQQEAGLNFRLATGRFQPILKKLTNLERDDPKLAFQTARTLGLYRHTSASCVSMPLDKKKLDPYVKVIEELASICTMRKTASSLVPISNYLNFIALNGA